MPIYTYRAMTRAGLVVRNKIEMSSRQKLIENLKSNQMIPIDIKQLAYNSTAKNKKQKKNINDIQELMKNSNTTQLDKRNKKKLTTTEKINIYLNASSKVPQRDLVVFTQQFYLLKKANFNNIHALNTVIESTENLALKGILEDILGGVEAGEYMYSTMEYYEDVFPYIYINMIKVGELSGSLTTSLEQAVRYLDESHTLNKKIKSILIPNILQFVLLLVMLIVGTVFAVPAMQGVLDEVGSEEQLPAVTIWFADFLDTLAANWLIPTIVIVGIVAGIIAYIQTPKGKYQFHYFKYKMPVFGELIFAIDFSRLMKAMLLNLRNGMRIQEAIEVSKNVVGNYVMLSIVETAINNIHAGTSWIEPFEKSGLAKPMMIEMLNIGMQTDLTEMMDKLVEYIEIDIDNIIANIVKVLPQIVFSIVGIVLIFFVVVVLVPIIQIYMGNFLFSAYDI